MNWCLEILQTGGWVMYCLLLLSIWGISHIIQTILYLWRQSESFYSGFYLYLAQYRCKTTSPEIKELVQLYSEPFRAGLLHIRLVASLAPLLGLIGTTTGLQLTFSEIASSGMADPSIFSKGIYQALFTTIAGLTIAIPHMVAYNMLQAKFNRLKSSAMELVLQKSGDSNVS